MRILNDLQSLGITVSLSLAFSYTDTGNLEARISYIYFLCSLQMLSSYFHLGCRVHVYKLSCLIWHFLVLQTNSPYLSNLFEIKCYAIYLLKKYFVLLSLTLPRCCSPLPPPFTFRRRDEALRLYFPPTVLVFLDFSSL